MMRGHRLLVATCVGIGSGAWIGSKMNVDAQTSKHEKCNPNSVKAPASIYYNFPLSQLFVPSREYPLVSDVFATTILWIWAGRGG